MFIHQKIKASLLFLVVVFQAQATLCASDILDQLLTLGLEELINIPITTASGVEETLRNAPAAMVIITANDIKQRGYTNLPELLMDQPGMDFAVSNGSYYMTMYQRGYRTPFTQRTLFLVNGVEDNNLWSRAASIRFPISSKSKSSTALPAWFMAPMPILG
jgi:outer membrane receptor for ferrienterochelin and colicins